MNDTGTKYLTNEDIGTIRNKLESATSWLDFGIKKMKEVISAYYSNQMLKNFISVGGFGEEKMKELASQMEMCDEANKLLPELKIITEKYLSMQEKLNSTGANN